MVAERGSRELLQEECETLNPTMRKMRTLPCGQTLNRGNQVQDIDGKYQNEDEANKQKMKEAKNDTRVQDKEEHRHDDERRSQELLLIDDICIKKAKIVKKPRCDITKLMKLQTTGDVDDSKNTVRIEFASCGEQTVINSSVSTAENDRMNEKSEWDTKSCDTGTDVAHFARMRYVDDVMCHVVKNKGLELEGAWY